MKNLKIFGDSIIKGVTYNGQSYHLCQEHDFDTLRAQGVTVENNAKMGATIDAGLKQLDRKLGTCDGDTTVLFCFGDNDCGAGKKILPRAPCIAVPIDADQQRQQKRAGQYRKQHRMTAGTARE